ncbi:MAG: histidine phosphatase family protein [Clostridium sp.]|nr:histidine phosphatase family protein [Clostridium sp.]
MRNRPENQITLVMIRHGETKSNRERRYLGKSNEPLSEEGIEKLVEYKRLGIYPAVEGVFISPMQRCRQTAEILYPNMEPICVTEWTEIDFGIFEGKNYQELKKDERYQKWIDSGGTLPFPGGESRREFALRCEKGFEQMMQIIKMMRTIKGEGDRNMPKTLGVIAHGGTIMALLERYGDGDYFDYQTANGRGYLCACRMQDGKIALAVREKI